MTDYLVVYGCLTDFMFPMLIILIALIHSFHYCLVFLQSCRGVSWLVVGCRAHVKHLHCMSYHHRVIAIGNVRRSIDKMQLCHWILCMSVRSPTTRRHVVGQLTFGVWSKIDVPSIAVSTSIIRFRTQATNTSTTTNYANVAY